MNSEALSPGEIEQALNDEKKLFETMDAPFTRDREKNKTNYILDAIVPQLNELARGNPDAHLAKSEINERMYREDPESPGLLIQFRKMVEEGRPIEDLAFKLGEIVLLGAQIGNIQPDLRMSFCDKKEDPYGGMTREDMLEFAIARYTQTLEGKSESYIKEFLKRIIASKDIPLGKIDYSEVINDVDEIFADRERRREVLGDIAELREEQKGMSEVTRLSAEQLKKGDVIIFERRSADFAYARALITDMEPDDPRRLQVEAGIAEVDRITQEMDKYEVANPIRIKLHEDLQKVPEKYIPVEIRRLVLITRAEVEAVKTVSLKAGSFRQVFVSAISHSPSVSQYKRYSIRETYRIAGTLIRFEGSFRPGEILTTQEDPNALLETQNIKGLEEEDVTKSTTSPIDLMYYKPAERSEPQPEALGTHE